MFCLTVKCPRHHIYDHPVSYNLDFMKAVKFLVMKERYWNPLWSSFANNLIAWNSLWMTENNFHVSEVAASIVVWNTTPLLVTSECPTNCLGMPGTLQLCMIWKDPSHQLLGTFHDNPRERYKTWQNTNSLFHWGNLIL